MTDETKATVGLVVAVVCMVVAWLLLVWVKPALAHDLDHPELDQWYATQKQPDTGISCCGKADAYWCDDIHVRDGKNFCTITDDREIAGRTPFPSGTEIEIPDRKFANNGGNPTGHSVIWLSSGGAVYCFSVGALI